MYVSSLKRIETVKVYCGNECVITVGGEARRYKGMCKSVVLAIPCITVCKYLCIVDSPFDYKYR